MPPSSTFDNHLFTKAVLRCGLCLLRNIINIHGKWSWVRRSRPSAGKARPNVPLGTGGQFACFGHTYESLSQKLGLSPARPKGLGHSRGYFISFLIKYLTGSNLTDSVHLLDIFSLWSNLSQKALRSSTYSLLTPLVATVCSSLTYWLRRDLFLRNVVTIKTEVLLWCDSV